MKRSLQYIIKIFKSACCKMLHINYPVFILKTDESKKPYT